MAKYGPDDLTIEVDADSGGSLTDVSAHVDTISGLSVEAIIEQSNTFGDTWVENLFTGVSRAGAVTLEGFYDDSDSSADAKTMYLNSSGETRSVRFTWGGSNTSAFEAIITNFTRTGTRDGNLRYSVTLTPTGAVTEA